MRPRDRAGSALVFFAFLVACAPSGDGAGGGGDEASGLGGDAGSGAGDGPGGPGGQGGQNQRDGVDGGGTPQAGGGPPKAGGGPGSGGAGGAGGTSGDAGVDAAPPAVLPSLQNGRYSFAVGDLVLVVDPRIGGRVVSFQRAGVEVLTGAAVNADNWGSTFWPSPQSDWNWPPPAEIDKYPYQPVLVGDSLVLTGATHAALGLAVEKRVRVDAATETVHFTFTIDNRGGAPRAVAPWQITRVFPGGLTFFPVGPGGIFRQGAWDAFPVGTREGFAWFDHESATISKSHKLFADGQGYLAHALPTSRLLFVKSFDDVADKGWAPGEAEIEVYVDGGKTYVELEPQGTLTSIPAGSRRTWSVRWRLEKIPDTISISTGSVNLRNMAAALAR